MKIKYRYTYRLTRLSDSAFYIGSRSAATCPPEEDFGTHYFTSGVLEKEFRANPDQFAWKIHSEDYADDVAMLEDERRLIQESWDEPGRTNRSAWPLVFEMDEEWREKMHDLYQSPEWLKKTTEGAKRRSLNPEWQKNNAEGAKKRAQDPEWRKKNAENPYNFSRMAQDPEWLEKNAERTRQMAQDPEWRKKNAEGAKKRALDPVWQEKNAEAAKKRALDPVWRKKNAEAAKKRGARQRAARLANEDTLPFDQPRVPVKKNRG